MISGLIKQAAKDVGFFIAGVCIIALFPVWWPIKVGHGFAVRSHKINWLKPEHWY